MRASPAGDMGSKRGSRKKSGAVIVEGSEKRLVSCCERLERKDGKAQCTLDYESFLACIRHNIRPIWIESGVP